MSEALAQARAYAAAARGVVAERVAASSLDAQQSLAHGYAWIETLVEGLASLAAWGNRQQGDVARLITAIGGRTISFCPIGRPPPSCPQISPVPI